MEATGTILMYHRITHADIDPWGMCVTPDNFSEQLEVINALGTPMPLEDFVEAQQSGKLPQGAIVLTFDDGYVDNFTHAFPLLQKYSVPASIFITSCNIDSDREFWWDELESVLLRPSELPDVLELELMGESYRWELGDASFYDHDQFRRDRNVVAWLSEAGSRMKFYHQVWTALWPINALERKHTIMKLRQWAEFTSSPDAIRRTMTSDEIRNLAESEIVTIGSHTSDHSPLPSHSREVQRNEIQLCQQKLQQILSRPLKSFAYPHGEFTNDTVEILKESGVEIALTVQQMQVRSDTDPMRMPRYGVKDMNGQAFERQLLAWRNQ